MSAVNGRTTPRCWISPSMIILAAMAAGNPTVLAIAECPPCAAGCPYTTKLMPRSSRRPSLQRMPTSWRSTIRSRSLSPKASLFERK
uniref:Putative secreted peptide n=1 Tax=Anopheles braziliensis TaxID=58242 RepID=A0A2M3ZUX9_9DIPT